MRARAPIRAKAKLVASAEWQEPIRDGQKKHVRFIWATQFGVGSSGAGSLGRKNKPARRLSKMLAERPGAAAAAKARCEANRERNLRGLR